MVCMVWRIRTFRWLLAEQLTYKLDDLGVECEIGTDGDEATNNAPSTTKPFPIFMAVAGCVIVVVIVISLIAFLLVKLARNNKKRFDHVSQRNDLEIEEENGIFEESRTPTTTHVLHAYIVVTHNI
jgi:hypothetical protein